MTTLSVGIDGLLDEYVSRVETLIDLVNIKPILEDEDDIQVPVYSDIAKAAVHLANMCRGSETQLAKSREHHKELQELHRDLSEMNKSISFLSDNVPSYLPAPEPSASKETTVATPVQASQSKISKQKPNSCTSKPPTKRLRKKPPPQLSYIKGKEFDSVPKYMKGRILYSDVNKCIDVVNTTAVEKYKVVSKAQGLTDFQRRKKLEYKQLEDKSTENTHFVVDVDIAEFTSTKLDKQFYSILTILRHCGRIKQSRIGKVTRYILNPESTE